MNALPSQRWPEPPDANRMVAIAREEMSDEDHRDVILSVADKFGGVDGSESGIEMYTAVRDALADQIETLSNAHDMLDLLFKDDITINQAIERTKHNTGCIVSLRTLRNLTEQCSKAVDEEMDDKAREIANV